MNFNDLKDNVFIYNEDCLHSAHRFADESIDLGVFDPPFGIHESTFGKHYKRNSKHVLHGYCEAPQDYGQWTLAWMREAVRVLKPNGSMYVFSGHSNLRHVLNAADGLGLVERNHIIWKYNFGVFTRNKYVTSHYHILYYTKPKAKPTFNTYCRFGSQDIAQDGGKKLYDDLEDVFTINREYASGKTKNQNKLPTEIIDKLLLYSSNPGDTICDFFMGNFTTAYSALSLGRKVCGYEKNSTAYEYHIPIITRIDFGYQLAQLPIVVNAVPINARKPITIEDIDNICIEYAQMKANKWAVKDIYGSLQMKYGRGRFSIKNILDKYLPSKGVHHELQTSNLP